MKRKLKWLTIVLAVSLLGFGTAFLLWPRDRITAESWQKIRIGMTEEEVVEILGGPGITWEDALAEYQRLEKEMGKPPYEIENPSLEEPNGLVPVAYTVKVWTGRRGIMEIDFDLDNHVRWKGFHGIRWINGGILDRLRDWLGW